MHKLTTRLRQQDMGFLVLGIIALLFILLVPPSPAHANLITYTLNNVTFQDGGSATGTITYDAATQILTNYNVTLTDSHFSGSSQVNLSSTGIMNGVDGDFSGVWGGSLQMVYGTSDIVTQYDLYSYQPSQTGVSAMQLVVAGNTGGGTLYVPTYLNYGHSYIINDYLTPYAYSTNIVTGTLIEQPVQTPEPNSLVLLGAGLFCLLLPARKHFKRI